MSRKMPSAAVTRIRTEVAAATTQSTNHYTITARHPSGRGLGRRCGASGRKVVPGTAPRSFRRNRRAAAAVPCGPTTLGRGYTSPSPRRRCAAKNPQPPSPDPHPARASARGPGDVRRPAPPRPHPLPPAAPRGPGRLPLLTTPSSTTAAPQLRPPWRGVSRAPPAPKVGEGGTGGRNRPGAADVCLALPGRRRRKAGGSP